jgi:hypothetical protein
MEDYERQRKIRQRKVDRLKEVFDKEAILKRAEEYVYELYSGPSPKPPAKIKILIYIEFDKNELYERQWLIYPNTLLQMNDPWREFNPTIQPKKLMGPRRGYILSIEVEPIVYRGLVVRTSTSEKVKKFLSGFLFPHSFNFAKYLTVELSTPQKTVSISFKSKEAPPLLPVEYIDKREYSDAITLEDMPLVKSYYQSIQEYLFRDIDGRGLTLVCAVKKGEGESIIRRNDEKGKRLVATTSEDIGNFIEMYKGFRFIADVNFYGYKTLNRIPFDFDPSLTMSHEEGRDFVNEFCVWLGNRGMRYKIRKSGGDFYHVVLDMNYDRVPEDYIPFPRPLKFSTWFSRLGEYGILYASAADFVKIATLGFAVERKMKYGKRSRITIEEMDVGQRFKNMFIDSSRTTKNVGIASIGTLNHKTGNVCMPVKKLPEKDSIEEIIKVSNKPDLKVPERIDPKYKNIWIYLVGQNPELLHERVGDSNYNSMKHVNEIFEEFSWIPVKYAELGSEKFLAKYCW